MFYSSFPAFPVRVFPDNPIDISDDIIYKLDNPRKFIPDFRRKKMTVSALVSLPADLNDTVLGYLDLFDIMKTSRVCTELYHTIHTDEGELACTDTKMQRPIMHVCSPRKNKDVMDMLLNLRTAHGRKEYGKCYEHMLVVQDSHLYRWKDRKTIGDVEETLEGEIKSLKRDSFDFANIQYLGFSSLVDSGINNEPSSISLSNILPCLLPNLQELNISGVGTCLKQLVDNCPKLQKLEWNNIQEAMHVPLYGIMSDTRFLTTSFKGSFKEFLCHVRDVSIMLHASGGYHEERDISDIYSDTYLGLLYWLITGKITSVAEFQFMIRTLDYLEKNDFLKSFSCLQEVYMDNSEFICDDRDFFNPNSHPRKHMFMFLGSKSLTRVSIKNCSFKFRTSRKLEMPQDALIKFVRNAPKLRWFRSNLNIANIVMLRRERPMVEFVN